MEKRSHSGGGLLRNLGAAVAIFSLVMGLLVTFVWQNGCSFVGSFTLLILALLFIAGGLSALAGMVVLRRGQKPKPVG